jgi:CBS domain-containing protein
MLGRLRAKHCLKLYRKCSFIPPKIYFSNSPNDWDSSNAPVIEHEPILKTDLLIKPKLRISDILAIKDGSLFTVSDTATVAEAISHIVQQNMHCCLTLDAAGEVTGIFTARDILKYVHSTQHNNSEGSKNSKNRSKTTANELLSHKISDIIVRKEKLVYCSPDDTVRQCREIMFQLKIRNLPVIVNNECLGVISIQDLADSSFTLLDTGGKKGFLHNLSGRKGLPTGTKLNPDTKLHAKSGTKPGSITKNQPTLSLEVASYALPHPFKSSNGVASSRRNYGATELSSIADIEYCEDAHFTIRVSGTDPNHSQVYLCVADGVGSWRQFGVDPRNFSHRLVEKARHHDYYHHYNHYHHHHHYYCCYHYHHCHHHYYHRLVENARRLVEIDAANRDDLFSTSSIFSAITPDFQVRICIYEYM